MEPMNEKNYATKRVAVRPETYQALSQYADGLGVPMTDAIADLLAQSNAQHGTSDPVEAGWRQRRILETAATAQ